MITDNVLVAYECFHTIRNKREGKEGMCEARSTTLLSVRLPSPLAISAAAFSSGRASINDHQCVSHPFPTHVRQIQSCFPSERAHSCVYEPGHPARRHYSTLICPLCWRQSSPITPFPIVATLTPIDHVAMVKPSSRTFPQQRPKRNASRESPGRVHGTTTSGSRWTHSVKLNQLPSRSASHRQTLLRPAYRRPHWRKWMTGFRNVAFSHIKDAQVFVDRVTAEVVQAAEASSACGVTFKQKSP